MTKPFRVMLAGKAERDQISFPKLASPKIDGVRAYVRGGVVYARSNKPIPNKHVQKLFGNAACEGLDGELTVGSPCAPDTFLVTTSAVRRVEGEPDVVFRVFDKIEAAVPFSERLRHAFAHENLATPGTVVVIPHHVVESLEALEVFERMCLELGFEGAMVRDPNGAYKQGRSTAKEQGLLKLKVFVDSEAVILGVVQLMHNANDAEESETGHTKRSKLKENLVPLEMVGAFKVRDIHDGREFELGAGEAFTHENRSAWWAAREQMVGRIVRYKHFPIGAKDKPRLPLLDGLRETFDMD